MPRICHFSDLHSSFVPMPEADLYVCTGDMLPNFISEDYLMPDGTVTRWFINDWVLGKGRQQTRPRGKYLSREITRSKEEEYQRLWIDQLDSLGGFRKLFMGNPDAPVVCVRGNHDFTDLSPLFGGDVWEVNLDQSRVTDVCGLRIGGLRGINAISGEWSDELKGEEFSDRVRGLPSMALDVLITHTPPLGILDKLGSGYGDPEARVGTPALATYLQTQLFQNHPIRAHLFGHIHGSFGFVVNEGPESDMLFANSATGYQVFDI